MPPPRPRTRAPLPDALPFEYPQHLREAIHDLPQVPGVYIFHGDGELPLYIGKSVQIRSRVLSHLRNPDEASLLRQTRAITHVPTAGELGALLLEAQMIKAQQPLKNQRLRRNRQLCAIRLQGERPEVVTTRDVNFATEPHLHGLYRSPRAALDGLRDLADEHRLCLGLLGVERLSPGRACFRAMVNKCGGACTGRESPADHQARLQAALLQMRLACWPYPGAIAIVEESHGLREFLVVRNWCYLGKATTLKEARKLDSVAAGFDADGYKILCGPVLTGGANIVVL